MNRRVSSQTADKALCHEKCYGTDHSAKKINHNHCAQDWHKFFLPAELHGMIATAAYYYAQQRNFAPGHEQEDWFKAEAEINQTLFKD